MRTDYIFSSGSVTEGHPDKLCDQISDAIVDRYLQQDRLASIVAETAMATGVVFIANHFASTAQVDAPQVARQVIEEVGYREGEFNAHDATIMTSLGEAPARFRPAVDEQEMTDAELDRVVAGHQLSMFGYACKQTPELMPLPIVLAHALARRMSHSRKEGHLPYLIPDGQAHVAVEYRDRLPARIHSITLIAGVEEGEGPSPAELESLLLGQVVEAVFADREIRPDADTPIFVNPEGPILVGGPVAHAGLTGRKGAVDCYGQYARCSDAALSGKDPSRIDRVGAYAARYAAKNVVAAGLAEECEVQLGYSVGSARPVTVQVDAFDTGRISEAQIVERLKTAIDFRPAALVRDLGLRDLPAQRQGYFRKLAVYGQMGRAEIDPPWERTDRAERLR
jgi:S-adenosylmethionine synthetase